MRKLLLLTTLMSCGLARRGYPIKFTLDWKI